MGTDIYEAPALAKGIAVARFAPPGSEELADNLVVALKDKVAALMPNHGITTIGRTIEEAAQNARIAERLAKLHYEVMQVEIPKPMPGEILKGLVERARKEGLLV